MNKANETVARKTPKADDEEPKTQMGKPLFIFNGGVGRFKERKREKDSLLLTEHLL